MPQSHNEATYYCLTTSNPLNHAFLKTNVFFFQNTCILWNLLCTLGLVTLCQTKPKANTKPQLKAARLEWLLYAKPSPKPQHTHPAQKPVVSLWPPATYQPTSSRRSALHYHGRATCVGAGLSRVLTLKILQSPLSGTSTGYVSFFDVLSSSHLGL